VKPVIVDTGVIVALLDRSENKHDLCSETVRKIHGPLVTCEPVIAESCYLLRSLPGAAEVILRNVEAAIFQIPFQLSHETPAVRSILRKYGDREVDLADACLIRLAEMAGTGEILTLDRDFSVYRWGKNKMFHILPWGLKGGIMAFVKAIKVGELAPGKMHAMQIGEREIALANVDGKFYAINNTCLHQGGPLGEGDLGGKVVTCPWHGWQFDVTTGKEVQNPSSGVACYPTEIRGDEVFVDVGSWWNELGRKSAESF
jgi:uncharacterized protein